MSVVLRLTLCLYRGHASLVFVAGWRSTVVSLFQMMFLWCLMLWPYAFGPCEFHFGFLFVYFLCLVSLSAGWSCCVVVRAFVLSCFDIVCFWSFGLFTLSYHCWGNCRFWRRNAGPTVKQCMCSFSLLALSSSGPFGAFFFFREWKLPASVCIEYVPGNCLTSNFVMLFLILWVLCPLSDFLFATDMQRINCAVWAMVMFCCGFLCSGRPVARHSSTTRFPWYLGNDPTCALFKAFS